MQRRMSSGLPGITRAVSSADLHRSKSNTLSDVRRPSSHEYPHGMKRPLPDQRGTLSASVDWGAHKRRDSTDSTMSSHSSSSCTSSQVSSRPSTTVTNALQFQPLPHTHLASPFSRPNSNRLPDQAPAESPFGVLIADMETPLGAPPADPQRLAIMRTLKASGAQLPYYPGLDDGAGGSELLPSARYQCPYCSKRFNRPSSLKVNDLINPSMCRAPTSTLDSQIHINSHTGEKR